MPKRLKYEVKESTKKYWGNVQLESQPYFQLLKNGELVCEMTSSNLMENIVRQRFNEMAERFNKEPFKIDIE